MPLTFENNVLCLFFNHCLIMNLFASILSLAQILIYVKNDLGLTHWYYGDRPASQMPHQTTLDDMAVSAFVPCLVIGDFLILNRVYFTQMFLSHLQQEFLVTSDCNEGQVLCQEILMLVLLAGFLMNQGQVCLLLLDLIRSQPPKHQCLIFTKAV